MPIMQYFVIVLVDLRKHPDMFLQHPMVSVQEIFVDPVMAADGFTYERYAIEDWLRRKNTSPMTNAAMLNRNLISNHSLRGTVQLLFGGGAS